MEIALPGLSVMKQFCMPFLATFEKVKLDPGLSTENKGLAHLQSNHIKKDCIIADYDQVWSLLGGGGLINLEQLCVTTN